MWWLFRKGESGLQLNGGGDPDRHLATNTSPGLTAQDAFPWPQTSPVPIVTAGLQGCMFILGCTPRGSKPVRMSAHGRKRRCLQTPGFAEGRGRIKSGLLANPAQGPPPLWFSRQPQLESVQAPLPGRQTRDTDFPLGSDAKCSLSNSQ